MDRRLIPLRNLLLEKLRSRKGGFSLLEVMLAILLFGTGLVFILQVVSTGLFVGGQNESTVIAANLAQEKIEELRNASYAIIPVGPVLENPVSSFPGFTRSMSSTTPQTGLKQVTVNVSWSAKNSTMTTTMVTYVSDI